MPQKLSDAGGGAASIVCIDDNSLVKEAIARRIALESDFRWAGALGERDEIIERLLELEPDLVLLDIDMPGIDAFALVKLIGERLPSSRVVMFTGYSHPEYLEQALANGAWGYISKSESPTALLDALRRVLRGEVVCNDEVS
jgi:two-component system, NarL family, response regulator DesR